NNIGQAIEQRMRAGSLPGKPAYFFRTSGIAMAMLPDSAPSTFSDQECGFLILSHLTRGSYGSAIGLPASPSSGSLLARALARRRAAPAAGGRLCRREKRPLLGLVTTEGQNRAAHLSGSSAREAPGRIIPRASARLRGARRIASRRHSRR